MKTVKVLFYILLAVVGVVAIAYLLAAAVGTLMYIGIAVAILGLVVAIIRYWIRSHQERKHPVRQHAKAEKAADRALKEMERNVNKQRRTAKEGNLTVMRCVLHNQAEQ